MNKTKRFFENIKDKKVAFIGIGVSHRELIKLFLKKEIRVCLCDKRSAEELGEDYMELKKLGCEFSLGESYINEIFNCDIVFRTPGMYYLSPALTKAREQGIAVTSEMEVFFDLCPCKIIGITGTDGKTTTTTIISEMLKASGKTVHMGGNIGRALLPIIEEIKPDDIAVAELSSFQLISMRRSPDCALVTNVFPDHLNVHHDMDEYINAKRNLLIHQNAFSKTVLYMDNDISRSLSSDARGKLLFYSVKEKPLRGTYLDAEGYLSYTDKYNNIDERIFHKDIIKIPGMHNVQNYLGAAAMLYGEVSPDIMKSVAENFGGVEHRIEYVRTLDGVKYYNDSIATSPAAVTAGLNAFSEKLIVIAGGSDKGLDYSVLAKPVNDRVKLLILTGDTAEKIETAVKAYESYSSEKLKIIRVNSMEEAVHTARENAKENDIVTLSPASASFDKYKNFEERGRHFKSLVNALE